MSCESFFLSLGPIGWNLSRLGKSGSRYWLSNLVTFWSFSCTVSTGCKNTYIFTELLFPIIDNSYSSFLLISGAYFRNNWHSDCTYMLFVIYFCCHCWTDTWTASLSIERAFNEVRPNRETGNRPSKWGNGEFEASYSQRLSRKGCAGFFVFQIPVQGPSLPTTAWGRPECGCFGNSRGHVGHPSKRYSYHLWWLLS